MLHLEKRQMQRCILVLSNPRSGSSATTGTLNICGVSLGKSVATVKDQYNLKGYFENNKILHFNVKVLNDLKVNMHNPIELNESQINQAMKFKEELKNIIEDEYAGQKVFAIKDQRIVLLWEIYKQVLDELNILPKILKLTRNINAIAPSVQRMNSVPIQQGLNMARSYYKLIDKISQGRESVTISFEELIEQPIETAKKICEFAGIGFSSSKEAGVQQFIDRNLVNYK